MMHQHYRHKTNKTTQGLYTVHQIVQMKDPATRQWVDAVLYSVSEGKTPVNRARFVREKSDFLEKFEPVEKRTEI